MKNGDEMMVMENGDKHHWHFTVHLSPVLITIIHHQ